VPVTSFSRHFQGAFLREECLRVETWLKPWAKLFCPFVGAQTLYCDAGSPPERVPYQRVASPSQIVKPTASSPKRCLYDRAAGRIQDDPVQLTIILDSSEEVSHRGVSRLLMSDLLT
jgi:hypothetical protein